jgi:hypothetical protein
MASVSGGSKSYVWRQSTKSDWSGTYKFDNSYGLYDANGSSVGTAILYPDGRWRWTINNIDNIPYREGIADTLEDVIAAVAKICPSTQEAKVVHAGHRAKPMSEHPDASFTRYSR